MATKANWRSIQDHIEWLRGEIAAIDDEVKVFETRSDRFTDREKLEELSAVSSTIEASRQHIAELEAIIQRYQVV